MELKIERVSLAALEDSPVACTKEKLAAFRANPRLKDADEVAAILGRFGGQVAGWETVFPVALRWQGREVAALSGSGLWVDAALRRSGLGMELPELRYQAASSGIALGAGLSTMALPVHQLLGYDVFTLPRYVFLARSRAVVETKIAGLAGRLVAGAADAVLGGWATMARMVNAWRLRGLALWEVKIDELEKLEAVAAMVAADSRQFAEVHDAKWFKWMMTESVTSDAPARLWTLLRGNEIVGFALVKRRFHATASHRGFKNVWIGSIVEWGVRRGAEGIESALVLRIALTLRKTCDAIEVATDDARLGRCLRHWGARVVGEGNFVIKGAADSLWAKTPEVHQQANWRLRPAMGDNGL